MKKYKMIFTIHRVAAIFKGHIFDKIDASRVILQEHNVPWIF